MPELPEVETVARDLRPLITGATIVDATTFWARTLRGIDARGVRRRASPAGGSRAVGRRGKQLVVALYGGAFLTIHLKMTGQLFVVPPGRPARIRTSGSCSSSRTAARSGSATSASSGRIGLYRRDGRTIRSRRPGRSRCRTRSRRGVPAPDPRPQGPPQAAPPRPVVHRRRRQHLRRRGALGRPPPPAPDGEDAAAGRRAPPLARAPADPRRGGHPARLVDRRLHRARRRRRDAGPPPRSTSAPASRACAAGARSGGSSSAAGRPTSARGASGCPPPIGPAPERSFGRWRRRNASAGAGRSWAGRGASGLTDGRSGRRQGAPATAARGGRARVGRRLSDVDPSPDRRPPRGRDVRHPRQHHRVDRASATGSASSGPNGAGKTTLLRIAAGRDEPDGGEVHRKRGLTLGLLAQESHFDAAFMAAPDLRAAVRHGAAHLEVDGRDAGGASSATAASRSTAYADLQHQFEILGGYTLDQRVDEALSGLGFSRDEWAKPPTALSGGEQTRAALARLVIADPDLLLLDEPTNHLDIAALEWIEEHLRRRRGSLLVASHDRAFLDATVTPDLGAPRPAPDGRSAATTAPTTASASSATRGPPRTPTPRPSRSSARRSSSSATARTASSARCTSTRPASSGSRPSGSRRRRARASCGCRPPRSPAAGASRSGEIVVRIEDLVVGYLPGPRRARPPTGRRRREPHRVATGAVPRRPAGRPDRDRRAERRRQDDAPPDDRRRPAAARRRG